MWIPVAVTALVFVLASASAIVQARKGRWWTAVGTFLPSLGVAAMLGAMEWHRPALFWPAVAFVAAGFGAEAMAYWTTRTPGKQQAG
ncbi:hypothetical protein ABT124_05860 [Streptomyces sp. NPDC001982]|uniref:hypothetical protein n=1 Tax=unclassified Streptomyces TaxID=2593676 RepID=UPI00331A6682